MTGYRSVRIGLGVFAVLSVLDLLLPLYTDGENPPMSVALVASVIGLASLVLVLSAWRGARRAVLPLLVLRVLSALTAVPAFFVSGPPAAAIVSAAVLIVLTGVAVVLVFPAARRPASVGAR